MYATGNARSNHCRGAVNTPYVVLVLSTVSSKQPNSSEKPSRSVSSIHGPILFKASSCEGPSPYIPAAKSSSPYVSGSEHRYLHRIPFNLVSEFNFFLPSHFEFEGMQL
ncbi:hypothetical protein Nepgr_017715 [Nepenthes gracilis]|uniref:Uncharacterized protein n=1 Tax=Nepenthes gracilis TaxID=150966 RepID=A0AAD3SS30_NEPGR|nr:hypothetical protein Nepgr_017715 [Nepenthes gracilis]